jgi:hypothetical protein
MTRRKPKPSKPKPIGLQGGQFAAPPAQVTLPPMPWALPQPAPQATLEQQEQDA